MLPTFSTTDLGTSVAGGFAIESMRATPMGDVQVKGQDADSNVLFIAGDES